MNLQRSSSSVTLEAARIRSAGMFSSQPQCVSAFRIIHAGGAHPRREQKLPRAVHSNAGVPSNAPQWLSHRNALTSVPLRRPGFLNNPSATPRQSHNRLSNAAPPLPPGLLLTSASLGHSFVLPQLADAASDTAAAADVAPAADVMTSAGLPAFEGSFSEPIGAAVSDGTLETNMVISFLFVVAVVGLVVVTAGVGYLTFSDWRDRREVEELLKEDTAKATEESKKKGASGPKVSSLGAAKGFGQKGKE